MPNGYFSICTVDVSIWVNKDVKNPTKSLCPFIRTEVVTETKINPRPPDKVLDKKKNRESGLIDKYKKKNKGLYNISVL